MLWSAKLRLAVYNMSGKDTTRWFNRWIRKLGEPPVIYDYENVVSDAAQLQKAMINSGFLKARVAADTISDASHRKMKVVYDLYPGRPYVISDISYSFPNDTLRELVMSDSARFILRPGDLLDRSNLETERELITARLRNRGYYAFAKEFITFNADTTEDSREVSLSLTVNPPYPLRQGDLAIPTHSEYVVRNIYYIMDYDPGVTGDIRNYVAPDTVEYKDITILYGKNRYLRPGEVSYTHLNLPQT